MKRLESKIINAIREDYKNGERVSVIADRYKVNKLTVYKYIKSDSRDNTLSDDTILNIREDYTNGMDIDDIAKKYNIIPNTVYVHIRDLPKRHPEKVTKKLSNDIISGIRKDYMNTSIGIEDICTKYNIAAFTLYKYTEDLPKRCTEISNRVKEDIVNDYIRGITVANIASKYNVSTVTVYRYTKDVEKSDMDTILTKYVVEDYNNGMGINDISDKYGINKYILYHYFSQNNIKRRKK